MRGIINVSDPQLDPSSDQDAVLLSLENRFMTLAAQLGHDICGHPDEQSDNDRMLANEAVLACLAPIERAIMETPAYTVMGLSVKANHVAYVLSEYWEAPIDQIDWEGRVVRLLIESIRNLACSPLLFREPQARK
jgi:hypothetical protein